MKQEEINIALSLAQHLHGLLERFLGKERNARRKSSTLMYSMDTGDSKNAIFILFLLRPNLALKVRESRNF